MTAPNVFIQSRSISLVMLFCGVALIQRHSIEFWSQEIDPYTGTAFSIMAELVALSLWSSPRIITRSLAIIATMVLLLGPLYLLAEPIYRGIERTHRTEEQHQKLIAHYNHTIRRHEQDLKTFRENSKGRAGWLPSIQKSQDKISQLEGERLSIQKRMITEGRLKWEQTIPIGMYALLLIIIQINNVRMVRLLATDQSVEPTPAKEHPSYKPVCNISAVNQPDVFFLQTKLKSTLGLLQMTQRQCASKWHINETEISRLLNYKSGRRKPSVLTLETIALELKASNP